MNAVINDIPVDVNNNLALISLSKAPTRSVMHSTSATVSNYEPNGSIASHERLLTSQKHRHSTETVAPRGKARLRWIKVLCIKIVNYNAYQHRAHVAIRKENTSNLK
jgi:hypothetical protein